MTETDVATDAPASYRAAVARRVAAIVSPTTRVIGIDVARGLAVLGMFAAHVGVTTDFEWGQPSTWLDIVNGRSAILFAVLAGVSIAIISGRERVPEGHDLRSARLRIFARAAIIFVIGGLLEYLGTGIAIILPTYAALFVVAIPFLRWRPRKLFLTAALIAVFMPFVLFEPAESFGPDNYFLGGGAAIDIFITGTYPAALWIAFVLLGLAIGRLDLRSLGVQVRILAVGVALAAVAYTAGGVGSALLEPADGDIRSAVVESSESSESSGEWFQVPGEEVDLAGTVCDSYDDGSYYCYPENYAPEAKPDDVGDSVTDSPLFYDFSPLVTIAAHSGSPFEVVGSGGFALAIIALCLLVTRFRVARIASLPLACLGAAALTAYTAHVVVIFVLGEFAFARDSNELLIEFVLVALALFTACTLLFGRGPLEQLLARVAAETAETARPAQTTPPAAGRLGNDNPHKENTNT